MDKFNFEDLEVWQKSVEFANTVLSILETIETNRKHYRLYEQMESAVTSISMNISEGKGRFSRKEFIRFLHIARGSLFEVITLLIIFERRKWISEKQLAELKNYAIRIGKMINGLINSIK